MNTLLVSIGVIFCLWIGKPLFIPLLIAIFVWYLINAVAAYYRKIMPCYNLFNGSCKLYSKLFNFVSILLAFATLSGIVYLFATQIKPMLSEFYLSIPMLQQKLLIFSQYLSVKYNLTISSIPNISQFATNFVSSIAGGITSFGMFIIYFIFLFVEQSTFMKKFNSLPVSKQKAKKLYFILSSIDKNMKKYLFMKTTISFLTGISAYILLSIFNIEYAGVWAFIIFILNYIPTIGSIFACALPVLYTLINGTELHIIAFVLIGLIGIQIIFGNILDPKLTGKTLNISSLAILINLVFWGMIWGPAGMFFSVPILVALYVTTAQFDSTRWIAVLLSTDGNIPDKNAED